MAGKLCYGTLGHAEVRSGLVWQFRHGMFRSGMVGSGMAGKLRYGRLGLGKAG